MPIRRSVWLTPPDEHEQRSRQAPRMVRPARRRGGSRVGDHRPGGRRAVPPHLRRGPARVTGPARKDDDDDASNAAPSAWALPADAAVATGGGMSTPESGAVAASAAA